MPSLRRSDEAKSPEREVLIWLFHWLWRNKDRVSRLSCPPFPETVVYEYHSPRAWFCYKSNGDRPEVIKKPLHDCDTTSILHSFCGKETALDLVPWPTPHDPDLRQIP